MTDEEARIAAYRVVDRMLRRLPWPGEAGWQEWASPLEMGGAEPLRVREALEEIAQAMRTAGEMKCPLK